MQAGGKSAPSAVSAISIHHCTSSPGQPEAWLFQGRRKGKCGSSWWMFAKLRPSKSSQMHVFRSAACANTDATLLWNIHLSHHVQHDSHLGSQLRTKGSFFPPNTYGCKWLLFPRWQKHLSYIIPILQASAHFLLFLLWFHLCKFCLKKIKI